MSQPGLEFLIHLLGGIALLLWGVRMVRTGVTRAFGAQLRRLLAQGTASRPRAFALGVFVTAILQSSTATSLIIAGFAGRTMMTTAAALAVLLGADVGSTLVAQVLAFDLSLLSPLFLMVGMGVFLGVQRNPYRQMGRAGIGLGLMLLSLTLIVGASEGLRDSALLQQVMQGLANEPLIAFLLAVLLTWLAHSSLAMVLLFLSLAGSGIIPLQLALVLVLGANVGAAIGPVAITSGEGALARRPALGNLMMRGVGALVALAFIPQVMELLALLGGSEARQVVNLHTAFNLALALVFLPLTGLVASLLARMLPESEIAESEGRPRHLEADALSTPSVALANAARETLRLGDMVESMLRQSIEVFRRDDSRLMKELSASDDEVDRLQEAIKLYLTRLSREEMEEQESQRHTAILTFTTNLEHIGDIIDKNLMELASKKIKNRYSFSDSGLADIERMHATVTSNMKLALNVFISEDATLARELLDQKVAMRELELETAERHYERISQGLAVSIETSALHLDVIRDLKRINSHLTSVAYPILETRGELADSRLRRRAAEAKSGKKAKGLPLAATCSPVKPQH